MTSVFTRVSGWTAALALFLLPFVYTRDAIDPVQLVRFILVCGVIQLLSLTLLFTRNRTQSTITTGGVALFPVIVYAAYVVASSLSLYRSLSLADGAFELLRLVIFGAVLVMALYVFSMNERAVTTVATVLSAAAIVLSVVTVGQYFGVAFTNIPGNTVPSATLANRNLLSSCLFMLLPWAAVTLFSADTRLKRLGGGALIALLFSLVVSQTRTVWLAVGVAAIVTLVIGRFASGVRVFSSIRSRANRREVITYLIIAMVTILIAIASHSLTPQESRTSPSLLNTSTESLNVRLSLWRKTLSLITEHPIIGCGLTNWRLMIPRYGTDGLPSAEVTTIVQRPHNDYFWVLAESGVAGLICFLSIFVVALTYCARLIRQTVNPWDRMIGGLFLYSMAGYMIIAFFSFPKERTEHQLLLILMLAVIFARYSHHYPLGRFVSRRALTGAAVTLFVVATLAMAVGIHRLDSEFHIKRYLALTARQDWSGALVQIRQAQSPFVDLDPSATPLAWYEGMAQFQLGDTSAARNCFERALRTNPYHLQVLNNLGTCHELLGDHERAIKYYKEALTVSPHLELTLLNLTAALYNAGDYEAALQTLHRVSGQSTDPRYELFRGRMGAIGGDSTVSRVHPGTGSQ